MSVSFINPTKKKDKSYLNERKENKIISRHLKISSGNVKKLRKIFPGKAVECYLSEEQKKDLIEMGFHSSDEINKLEKTSQKYCSSIKNLNCLIEDDSFKKVARDYFCSTKKGKEWYLVFDSIYNPLSDASKEISNKNGLLFWGNH